MNPDELLMDAVWETNRELMKQVTDLQMDMNSLKIRNRALESRNQYLRQKLSELW